MTDRELERLLAKLPGPITRCAIYNFPHAKAQGSVTIRCNGNSVRLNFESAQEAIEIAEALRLIRATARIVEGSS